ncbi:MAG: hypothetical protein NTV82_08400, partial [Candidatus Aminicenantes bacterium]|nr:hypothetical protein [Candidatus Aminicenantes bacterium]
ANPGCSYEQNENSLMQQLGDRPESPCHKEQERLDDLTGSSGEQGRRYKPYALYRLPDNQE